MLIFPVAVLCILVSYTCGIPPVHIVLQKLVCVKFWQNIPSSLQQLYPVPLFKISCSAPVPLPLITFPVSLSEISCCVPFPHPRSDNFSQFPISRHLVHTPLFWMFWIYCWLKCLLFCKDLRNGWQIISAKKSFAVYAATSTEKAEWMAHINKCVQDLVAKSKTIIQLLYIPKTSFTVGAWVQAWMLTHLFSTSPVRILAWCPCPITRSWPCIQECKCCWYLRYPVSGHSTCIILCRCSGTTCSVWAPNVNTLSLIQKKKIAILLTGIIGLNLVP